MDHAEAQRRIEEHFAGAESSPGDWADVRAHVRGCEACKAMFDRLARMEMAFTGSELSQARVDRVTAAGPPVEPSNVRRLFPGVLAPIAAAAAAVLLFVVVPDETRPRGSGPGSGAFITIYAAQNGTTSKVEDRIPAGAPLLFAYTTMSGATYRYLAIAGLDASGRAHWYHPAYTDAAQNPQSIHIERGRADQELSEEIRMKHAAGRLEICGLFSEAPLSVKEVDRRLESEHRWPDGVHRDCHVVEVQP